MVHPAFEQYKNRRLFTCKTENLLTAVQAVKRDKCSRITLNIDYDRMILNISNNGMMYTIEGLNRPWN